MKLYDTTQIPEQTDMQADVTPQDQSPKPFSYRAKNWWYYHKWYVICGIILVFILGDIAWNALGIGTKKPDFQIAYVGKLPLPDDTVVALEQAFASLSGDFNGDGEAIVQVNQYTLDFRSADSEAASTNYTSEIQLMADLSACESYFFLTDDPEALQQGLQIFAGPDGSAPDETDVSVADKVLLWADCSALTDMDLGSYTISVAGSEITGDSQELLSGLSLGRRYFVGGKTIDSISQCDELWNRISKNLPASESP